MTKIKRRTGMMKSFRWWATQQELQLHDPANLALFHMPLFGISVYCGIANGVHKAGWPLSLHFDSA